MILYHADDYGINMEQSERILRCRKEGFLNSVSIVPNSKYMGAAVGILDREIKKGVHINLCEGESLCSASELSLLTDGNGKFNKSFFSLFLISLIHGRELEVQVKKECYLQIKAVLKYMPDNYKLRVDSHRHYHLIPAVMRGLIGAIEETGAKVEYFRLPVEDLKLYLRAPKIWKRINCLSLFKTFVLIMFTWYDKGFLKKAGLYDKAGKYMGLVFTDRMFVENLMPLMQVIKKDKHYLGKDIEIQFHPGAIYEGEYLLDDTFKDWFASPNRKREAETMITGLER